jgi:hypothetical protein
VTVTAVAFIWTGLRLRPKPATSRVGERDTDEPVLIA